MLGVIVSSSRDQLESSVSPFKCSIQDDINIQPDDVLYVTVLENLVTALRCFEALTTSQTRNIAFILRERREVVWPCRNGVTRGHPTYNIKVSAQLSFTTTAYLVRL